MLKPLFNRSALVLALGSMLPVAAQAQSADVSDIQDTKGIDLILPDAERGIEGYCAYVLNVADSERALLNAPEVFARGGAVNASAAFQPIDSPSSIDTAGRVTAGLSYDFINLARSGSVRDAARAECRRFRARQKLEALLEIGQSVGLVEAHQAKLAVLKSAVPRAERVVARSESALLRNRGTIQELYAAQKRLDELRRLLSEAQAGLDGLAGLPQADGESIDYWLQEYHQADSALVREQADLRKSKAFKVEARAAYDQVYGRENNFPVLAMLELSFNPGRFFQGKKEAQAGRARRAWQVNERHSVETQTSRLIEYARASQIRAERRRTEVDGLLASVAQRRTKLGQIDGLRAAEYDNFLWFEEVQLRAEAAYLDAFLASLKSFLS